MTFDGKAQVDVITMLILFKSRTEDPLLTSVVGLVLAIICYEVIHLDSHDCVNIDR